MDPDDNRPAPLASPAQPQQPVAIGEVKTASHALHAHRERGALQAQNAAERMRENYGRVELRLDSASRVLVINTEGATDPDRYEALVGMSPAAVARPC